MPPRAAAVSGFRAGGIAAILRAMASDPTDPRGACLPVLTTGRLILRAFEPRDEAGFAAMNADRRTMEHFPAPLSVEESRALMARLGARAAAEGVCFCAVERRADAAFLGMVGLSRVRFARPLQGALEVGWRLAPAQWGQGYATEAARRWLGWGFDALDAPEIVAFTVAHNRASQAVMHRLGMRRDPSRDFGHPALPEGHLLRPHVLHALRREDRAT